MGQWMEEHHEACALAYARAQRWDRRLWRWLTGRMT